MGGEGDHVGHSHRVRVHTAGDETGRVGDVEHEPRSYGVGDLTERLGLDETGVGGGAGHDELGALALGHVRHLVEVDDLAGMRRVVRGRGHPVGDEPPDLARDAGRGAVGQVAALVEPHGQDRVPGLEERLVHGQVGGGPGMRLDVGVLGSEQGLGPLTGQVLDLVDDPVASVVATPRVPLRVLVGEHRPRGGEHGGRGEVLRCDQLEGRRLAPGLGPQQPRHLVVVR